MNLLTIECRRTRLKPYGRAAGVCGAVLLGFLYFFAAIPWLDPADPDSRLFADCGFLLHLVGLLALAAFTILGGVAGARIVVEAYGGRQALLLFGCPVPRGRVLGAKLWLTAALPAGGMLVTGLAGLGVFLLSLRFWPQGPAPLDAGGLAAALWGLAAGSLTAGGLSLWAVWVGFRLRSVPATVAAAAAIATLFCQILSPAWQLSWLRAAGLAAAVAGGAAAALSLRRQVERMEV